MTSRLTPTCATHVVPPRFSCINCSWPSRAACIDRAQAFNPGASPCLQTCCLLAGREFDFCPWGQRSQTLQGIRCRASFGSCQSVACPSEELGCLGLSQHSDWRSLTATATQASSTSRWDLQSWTLSRRGSSHIRFAAWSCRMCCACWSRVFWLARSQMSRKNLNLSWTVSDSSSSL